MEIAARLVVAIATALPFVVLVLRGTRLDPFPRRPGAGGPDWLGGPDGAHDDAAALAGTAGPADADARRARSERIALAARGRAASDHLTHAAHAASRFGAPGRTRARTCPPA